MQKGGFFPAGIGKIRKAPQLTGSVGRRLPRQWFKVNLRPGQKGGPTASLFGFRFKIFR